MSLLDEISPAYVGEDRIRLALAPNQEKRAFRAVQVLVDFSRTAPEGIMLPLEFTVTSPSRRIERRYYRSLVPDYNWPTPKGGPLPPWVVSKASKPFIVIFKPTEGGPHLVRIAEVAHNRWWGQLIVEIEGSRLSLESY